MKIIILIIMLFPFISFSQKKTGWVDKIPKEYDTIFVKNLWQDSLYYRHWGKKKHSNVDSVTQHSKRKSYSGYEIRIKQIWVPIGFAPIDREHQDGEFIWRNSLKYLRKDRKTPFKDATLPEENN